jgi:WD40 repeat protein
MERSLVGTPCAFFVMVAGFAIRSEDVLTFFADQNKPGEIWAIALSADGQYLASSSINGKINVWSLNKEEGMPRIREYETKGSFGLCVDLVCSNFCHCYDRRH